MIINRECINSYAFLCAIIAILLVFPVLSPAQIRTVLVSPVPGDPVASGTALRNALAGIQSPSSSNPWLLKIEPGIYDVQASPLQMRPWVSIEGSGIESTKIRGNASTSLTSGQPFIIPNGTIHGANNTELKNLTIEAAGNDINLIAMLNRDVSPRVYRVRFVVQGNSSLWGMLNMGSESNPILEEIEVRVTGGTVTTGVEYQGTEARSELHRSRIVISGGTTISYGILLDRGRLSTIKDTIIETYFGASGSGIYVQSVYQNPVQDLSLSNVTIISASSTQSNYGINCNDVLNLNVFGSQITIYNQLLARGIRQFTGSIGVLNSYMVAGTSVVSSNGAVSISNSYLVGGPVTGSSTGCLGVSDEAGKFYTGSCPP